MDTKHTCSFLCPSRYHEGAAAYYAGRYACPEGYCRNERASWHTGRAAARDGRYDQLARERRQTTQE